MVRSRRMAKNDSLFCVFVNVWKKKESAVSTEALVYFGDLRKMKKKEGIIFLIAGLGEIAPRHLTM